ncbi:cytochrome P450 3A5-like isoform X2 [Centruroides sculpturatus]|uniref:cytochrome P450 3A5-like isoform X2 n=1 Tax=Centruroides sculpturatus TaxID=218467 RepID=UPI000C6DB15C|nr:cytochrome P450 3A5-like isoform X2 [Centruroides sculpturatus]
MGKLDQKWYEKYGKIFGIYEGFTPVLMIAEPKWIRNILVKDFQYFVDLRTPLFVDPIIDRMLYVQTGKKWRQMRVLITPTFTFSKIKMMTNLIIECAQTLAENLFEVAEEMIEVDIEKYFGAYFIDVIAKCAFGITLDSQKDPNNPFVKAARNTINPGPWKVYLSIFFPNLTKFLRLSVFARSTTRLFKKLLEEAIDKRKKMKDEEKPNDILQSLLEIRINDIIAKKFEKKAHELAKHPDIQEKLIKEIDETFKDKKEINYDSIVGMNYLDAVFQETLRLYTPLPRLERTLTKEYMFENTGVKIPTHTIVAIPTYAIHHDPQYFPDSDKFIPERFLSENKQTLYPYTNLPFGAGQRYCLGMRLATLEIKIALIKTLQRVRFRRGANTKDQPEFDKNKRLHYPKNVFLNFDVREDKLIT